MIIIDASKPDLYAKAHLKGAINLPYKELNQKEGKVEGLMESVENMAKVLVIKELEKMIQLWFMMKGVRSILPESSGC